MLKKKMISESKEAIEEFEFGNSGIGGSNYWLHQVGAIAACGDIEAEKCLCKVLETSNTEVLLKTAYHYLTEKVGDHSIETREALFKFRRNPCNVRLITEVEKRCCP